MPSRKRGCCFCSHSGCCSDTLQLLNISSVFCLERFFLIVCLIAITGEKLLVLHYIHPVFYINQYDHSFKTFLLPLTFISKFILALRGKFLSDKFVQLSVVLCTTQDPVWSSALQSRQQVSGEGERYLPVLHHSTLPGRMSG